MVEGRDHTREGGCITTRKGRARTSAQELMGVVASSHAALLTRAYTYLHFCSSPHYTRRVAQRVWAHACVEIPTHTHPLPVMCVVGGVVIVLLVLQTFSGAFSGAHLLFFSLSIGECRHEGMSVFLRVLASTPLPVSFWACQRFLVVNRLPLFDCVLLLLAFSLLFFPPLLQMLGACLRFLAPPSPSCRLPYTILGSCCFPLCITASVFQRSLFLSVCRLHRRWRASIAVLRGGSAF